MKNFSGRQSLVREARKTLSLSWDLEDELWTWWMQRRKSLTWLKEACWGHRVTGSQDGWGTASTGKLGTQVGVIHSGPLLVFLLKTKHFKEGVNDWICDLTRCLGGGTRREAGGLHRRRCICLEEGTDTWCLWANRGVNEGLRRRHRSCSVCSQICSSTFSALLLVTPEGSISQPVRQKNGGWEEASHQDISFYLHFFVKSLQ